jgi:hypothetical protein
MSLLLRNAFGMSTTAPDVWPQITVGPFSTRGTHLKEKALHVTARLGIANFLASSG